MLGVGDNQVFGLVGGQVAQIVQRSCERAVAVGGMAALRTGPSPIVARAFDAFGFGKVFNTRNALGDVGQVFAGSSHPDVLHEERNPSWKIVGLDRQKT